MHRPHWLSAHFYAHTLCLSLDDDDVDRLRMASEKSLLVGTFWQRSSRSFVACVKVLALLGGGSFFLSSLGARGSRVAYLGLFLHKGLVISTLHSTVHHAPSTLSLTYLDPLGVGRMSRHKVQVATAAVCGRHALPHPAPISK